MVIFDSLLEVVIALPNGTIADPFDVSLRTERRQGNDISYLTLDLTVGPKQKQ